MAEVRREKTIPRLLPIVPSVGLGKVPTLGGNIARKSYLRKEQIILREFYAHNYNVTFYT